jgi:hypothetical protein
LNHACWGGLATHLPGKFLRGRARRAVLGTNRYLDGGVFIGPVGVFLFFSAIWAEMQSSWVMAMLTSSLKLSALTKFNRSLSLVFRPRRKRSLLRASLSAWYPTYWHKWLKTCAYCMMVRVPWVRFRNSLSFRSMSPSGMWCARNAVRNSSQVTI